MLINWKSRSHLSGWSADEIDALIVGASEICHADNFDRSARSPWRKQLDNFTWYLHDTVEWLWSSAYDMTVSCCWIRHIGMSKGPQGTRGDC